MPDTGDFDPGSIDHGSIKQGPHDAGTHADWAGVFAALPQETPASDGWQRLQGRLPATKTHHRPRWPVWLATAASLALVIVIPLRMQSTTTTTMPGPSAVTPSPDPVTTPPATDVGIEIASAPIVPIPGNNPRSAMPSPATTGRVRKPRRDRHLDPSQRPIRTPALPAETTRTASVETNDMPASDIHLEPLFAQSAQLEGLLVLARDERISTGTAAALIDTLNGQVAGIDAALARPNVSLQERTDLWYSRVDSLRQLVGIETTQRLYAARGQQYEAALVSID